MTAQSYISLSELTGQIRATLRDAFGGMRYWVLADVVDHKFYEQKGAHYFCLAEKDKDTQSIKAKLQAVAWRDDGGLLIRQFEKTTGQLFKDGLQVLVYVSVNYNAAYGLQLALHDIDAAYTIGVLEQQRRATLDQLLRLCPDYIRLEGNRYYTRNNQLAHAPVIQRIAVITSDNAAGYRDFEDTIATNRHGYHISIDTYFTAVQGEANAGGLCQRLIDIYQSGREYDAVVIIRGGGSQTDFLIFEQFVIARAVAKFPIPIISGIGHQINETIVDLMAHTSVKTPSIAAEFILSHNRAFEESVVAMRSSIAMKALQMTATHRQHLTGLSHDICISGREAVLSARADLKNRAANLKLGVKQHLLHQKNSISQYEALIRMADPQHILKRGFALVYRNGSIISDGGTLNPADHVMIRMQGAVLDAIVQSKNTSDAAGYDL